METNRTRQLREKMVHRKASICSERAVFYTESFKQTEGQSYILRKAKAFAYTLDHMTIYFEPDSLIFGNQASRNFAAPIFPEYSIQWVIDELDEFDKREGDVFYIDEKTKDDLRAVAPYWLHHTHEDEVNRNLTKAIRLAEKQGVIHRGGISMSGDGHIVPDHPTVLKRGFRSIIEEAQLRMKTADEEQKNYYEAVIISLEGALRYFKRYGRLARDMYQKEADPKWLRIADMADTMMEQGARSFYEAVEVTYMIHLLQMIESNGHSFSYGRFDQYIEPYYEHDIKAGVLTQEEAQEITSHMFIMNSSLNKIRPYGHTRYSQGYPLYSNLVVGGLTPEGKDGTNAMTYICIEAMHQCGLAEPNFSARYHENSPQPYLEACAKLIRTGHGMPSMFNDKTVIKGLMDLGIPQADAYDYCPIGCVETGVPGKYGHRATGMTYVNWGKVFEIVMHHGTDPNSGITMLSDDTEYKTYDDLWNAWKKYLKFYSDISVECDAICDASLAVYDADPFASCLIQNSMEQGKTLKNGGCLYDVISQSNIGPSIVGNSLYTFKKLVYESHRYTPAQIVAACDANWQDPESKKIQNEILRLPKFGNDDDEVDAIVKDVFNSYLELLPGYSTLRKGKGPKVSCYTMSTSNITSYVPNGFVVGATPDGRIAGSPLNEGCSPTQGTDVNGPTAVINSVSKLPNEKVGAGQLLNMRFSKDSLAGDENLDRFVSFLKVSAKKGIYHNQFNVVSSQELRQAQIHPEQYEDLIVRVAGYCAQFVSLMPQTQDAIIARTENTF